MTYYWKSWFSTAFSSHLGHRRAQWRVSFLHVCCSSLYTLYFYMQHYLLLKQVLVHTDLNSANYPWGSDPCNKPCKICPHMNKPTTYQNWIICLFVCFHQVNDYGYLRAFLIVCKVDLRAKIIHKGIDLTKTSVLYCWWEWLVFHSVRVQHLRTVS